MSRATEQSIRYPEQGNTEFQIQITVIPVCLPPLVRLRTSSRWQESYAVLSGAIAIVYTTQPDTSNSKPSSLPRRRATIPATTIPFPSTNHIATPWNTQATLHSHLPCRLSPSATYIYHNRAPIAIANPCFTDVSPSQSNPQGLNRQAPIRMKERSQGRGRTGKGRKEGVSSPYGTAEPPPISCLH